MKKLFLIGGMGAGKSTARKALTDEGLAWIDLDQVGHEVLTWDTVKDDLRGAFGDDIFDENGEVVRSALAAGGGAPAAGARGLDASGGRRRGERPGRQGLCDAGRHAQAEHHHDAPHRGALHRPHRRL